MNCATNKTNATNETSKSSKSEIIASQIEKIENELADVLGDVLEEILQRNKKHERRDEHSEFNFDKCDECDKCCGHGVITEGNTDEDDEDDEDNESEDEDYSSIFDGRSVFLWGVKSGDELLTTPANLYTMNDIDLTYDKEALGFTICVETIYCFDTVYGEIIHYANLLAELRDWLVENKIIEVPFSTVIDDGVLEHEDGIKYFPSSLHGKTIPEVAMKFQKAVKTYINYLLERM